MALRDVELVEDEPELPAGADEPPARSWLRRHPAVVAAVAGTLLVAVGAGAFLELRARRQDAARAEALRDVPGVLEAVDPAFPVLSRFTLDDGEVSAQHQSLLTGVRVGDLTVTGLWYSGSDAVVVGVDDGAEVWRTVVPPPDGVERMEGAQAWCEGPGLVRGPRSDPPRELAADSVGCVATWPLDAAPTDDGRLPVHAAAVELDPADGRVLRRIDLPDDASATRVDGGWLSVVHQPGEAGPREGDMVVTLLADDGATLWSTTLPRPGGATYAWSSASAQDDRVLVLDAGGATVLDRRDGRVVQRYDQPGTSSGWLRPDGSLLLYTQQERSRDGRPLERVHLHRPDGTSTDLDGEELTMLSVDDGSLGDVLLTTREGDDARTTMRGADGTVRWRVDGAVRWALGLEGTVVAMRGDELVRLDATDGRVLWRAALPGATEQVQLMTDGAALLVAGGPRVDAWTFDGAHAWTGHVREEDGVVAVVAGAPAPSPSASRRVAAGFDSWWTATTDGRLAVQMLSRGGEDVVVVVG